MIETISSTTTIATTAADATTAMDTCLNNGVLMLQLWWQLLRPVWHEGGIDFCCVVD